MWRNAQGNTQYASSTEVSSRKAVHISPLQDRAERLFATKGHDVSAMEKKALKSDVLKEKAKMDALAKSEERIRRLL